MENKGIIDGIERGLKWRVDKRYSVLSLDGGGVRGIITTNILAHLEETIEQKIRQDPERSDYNFKITDAFDCIIGTSAGGLITLALASGYSARELRDQVMDKMIQDTFNQKNDCAITHYFSNKPTIEEEGLETQLKERLLEAMQRRGFEGEQPTLGDLRTLNPKLRVCITTLEYLDPSQNKGGSSFIPKIFDSDNPNDAKYTLLTVGRSTSAAPTYFRPVVIEEENDQGETIKRTFIDGGVFSNNPAGWGLVLAGTRVKDENIRLLSIGTGEAVTVQQDLDEGNLQRLGKQLKDWALEWLQIKDTSTEKAGAASWFSGEIIMKAVFDVQKQGDQLVDLFQKSGVLKHFHRLNPQLPEAIDLADASDEAIAKMKELTQVYLNQEDTKVKIEEVINTLLKPDDFARKAKQQLKDAAHILQILKDLKKGNLDEFKEAKSRLVKKSAIYLKVLNELLSDVDVEDHEIENQKVKIQQNLIKGGNLFKKEEDYPRLP